MPRPRRRPFLIALSLAGCCAVAAPALAKETPDIRLGRAVVPTFQSVKLRLDADKRSYTGAVRVDLRVTAATDTVRFHAEGQNLKRIALVQGGDTLAAQRYDGDHGLVQLVASRPLRPGAATLDIEFSHLFGSRAVGLYRVSAAGKNYLFTQFESDDAREAFPCWDEPGFKFPWQLTLEVPSRHEAFTNTPVASVTERDGWKTVVFEKTPPLPSYLIAIATGPLETVAVPGARVPTRIVTVQGQKHLTANAVEATPKLLAALERWFGTPYPFAKLDLVAVPEFAYGAMENPGLITYRDDLLLLDPATATFGQRRRQNLVNCHELAHMWFGDLVTMAWWDDLWLNESFADWMASKSTDDVFPDLKAGLNDLQAIQRVKQGDIEPSTQAIRSPTAASAAGLSNVQLVYNKGNAVLSMFEGYLGPEVFRKGVRDYLRAHAWGNATSADLWKALDAASGQNVSAAMATFLDQPGVPMVRVVPAEGGVRVSQSRATPFGVSQPGQRWRVPLVLRWSDGRRVQTTRLLLAEETRLVKLPGTVEWVMPDGGGSGYYGWSLPDERLEALALHAPEHLSPEERVAFLGNLNLLLATGDVHGDAYLRSLVPFGGDPEPQVVSSLMASLNQVRASFVPDSLAASFVPYVRSVLGPALDRFGLEPKPGEDETVSATRGDLLAWLATRGDDARVREFALAAARRYLADSSSVDPGIVDAVLGLAARGGDAAAFEEYRRRFEAAEVPGLRRRYLGVLGAFEDPALEARALEFMLSEAVRPTETFVILMGFGGKSEAAGQRLFDWLLTHYAELAARIPPPALRFMPMIGGGCSEERLRATRAFFTDPSRAVPGVEQTLERVGDQVRGCLSLREREGRAVGEYLRTLGAK